MAGHSKWANIKHRKGAQDAKRGKLFTKLIKEITVAAKMGGGDPSSNPRLRTAIDKALAGNMTRDTIDRAVKRGSGDMDGEDYQEIRYEGYGPNGVAIMVDCLTDNRNRTVSEVRHVFTKLGFSLGTDGSVSYLFTRMGQIYFDNSVDEEKLMDIAIEAGADDVSSEDDGSFIVNVNPDSFNDVLDNMKSQGLKPVQSDIEMVASNSVSLELDDAEIFIKMVDMLEDLDDVQTVHSNADIPQDVADKL